MTPAAIALWLVLAATASSASAQTVWRCGPDGRSYSDAPCPGGQVVAVADPRSAEMAAQARAVTEGQERLARRMAAERRERERELAARGTGLSAIEPVRPLVEFKPTAARPMATKRPKPRLKSRSGGGTSPSAPRAILGKTG